ncbi:MAG TPA: DUF2849 domain-containing protein [Stellaceae bacterium]|jgi:hypothetical protein|nr:DUF2849 domain-containing protein [Stellaceae bacterium]
MASGEPQTLVTGNRLIDGAVIYFTGDSGWARDISEAKLVDAEAGAALLAEAQAGKPPLPAIGAELIEAIRDGGRVVPVSLRERIRAFGPTVAHS